ALRHVERQAWEAVERNARRLGMSRRDYLASSCGAAAVFLAMNALGCRGGAYRLPDEAALDPAAAREALSGDEFIFDVQLHQVSAERVWWRDDRPSLDDFLRTTPQADCGAPLWARCFTDDVLIREVFLDSDTDF